MVKLKSYPKYKDSGVEWIGDIPEGWDVLKLKYFFDIVYRYPTYYGITYVNEGIREIRGEMLKGNGSIDIKNVPSRFISEKTSNKFPLTKLKIGDIVMSVRGTLGKIGLVNSEIEGSNITANLLRLSPDINKVDSNYLSLIMENQKFIDELDNQSDKTTIKTITVPRLLNIFGPLPTISEQRILSKYTLNKRREIDSLISDKERLIELLEEKRQAVITETVTKGLDPDVKMKDSGVEWIGEIPEHWEMAKLKRFIIVMNGKEIEVEKELTDLDAVDVFGSGGVFKKTDKPIFKGESVLFGRKGTIGKPIYVDQSFWTVDTMYYTKFHEKAFPKWFYYLFYIFPWAVYTTNTALPSLVGTDIENDLCAIPNYDEQREIASYLDEQTSQLDDVILGIRKQISKLKEYRESLIYEAVTGKIYVRDYASEMEEVN